MAEYDAPPAARGDEGELFRDFNDELVRTVRGAVHVSTPQIVEDACAFAWVAFMQAQPDRENNWRGWLFRVAQRESWRLEREAGEHVPTRTYEYEDDGTWLAVDRRDHAEIRDGIMDAFSALERLPERLRRVKLLRALGLRHQDIGEITGDSPTRVAQLIGDANIKLYDLQAEQAIASIDAPPRVQRLVELEREQPTWLTDRIGPLRKVTRRLSNNDQRRAWRRAALALDDYRSALGPREFEERGDVEPNDPELRRQYELARRTITELDHLRSRSIGRGLGD